MIAHWDEVAPDADLAQAAGAVAVSLRRYELAPGELVELPRRETEDVLFVVAGGGDGLRAGDCVVYPAPHDTPTLRAGDDGLTALLFATPAQPPPFHSGEREQPRTRQEWERLGNRAANQQRALLPVPPHECGRREAAE